MDLPTKKSISNSNLGRKFPLLLLTEKSVDKFVGKKIELLTNFSINK